MSAFILRATSISMHESAIFKRFNLPKISFIGSISFSCSICSWVHPQTTVTLMAAQGVLPNFTEKFVSYEYCLSASNL